MDKLKYDLICPLCCKAVQLWKNEPCSFHLYFHMNRVRYKSYEDLVEAFFEEHPDLKKPDGGKDK